MSYADIRKKYGLSEGAQTPTADTQRQNTAGYTAIRKKYGLTEASAKTSREWYSKFDSAEMHEQAKKHTRESGSDYVVSNDPVYTAPNIDLAQYDSPAAAVGAYAGQLISNALRGGDDDTRTWFQKGAFEDGYQAGDVTKAASATALDVRGDVTAGAVDFGEKLIDFIAMMAAANEGTKMRMAANDAVVHAALTGGDTEKDYHAAYAQMGQDVMDQAANFVAENLYDEQKVGNWAAENLTLHGQINKAFGVDTERDSVLGEKSDALVQSAGQLAGQYGLSSVGIPWFLTSGVSSFASEAESALQQGATFGEAGLSGMITAGAEILTEKLFSGDLFINKAGFDNVVKELTEGISNKFIKKATRFGLNSFGEGAEEWVSTRIGQFGQWLSYNHDEKTLLQMLYSEEALDEAMDSFFGGTVLGSGMGGIKAIASDSKLGTDTTVVDTANQTDYDNTTNQGGTVYADTQYQGGSLHSGGVQWNPQGDPQGKAAGSTENGKRNVQSGYQSWLYGGHGERTVHTADSEGRTLSAEQSTKLQGTAVTDSSGAPLALYHATDDMDFTTFERGDTGFHFGSAEQAAEHSRKRRYSTGRTFRAYLNIKNPVRTNQDIMGWHPGGTALRLWGDGILNDSEMQEITALYRIGDDYGSASATRLREILESKGYDGIAYPNGFEGDGMSYMAFHDSQIIKTDISRFSEQDNLSDQSVLERAIASMDTRPMNPRIYNELNTYSRQLQHLDTTQMLLDQKKSILQQQQASGAPLSQIQQTETDIAKLDKMLAAQQQKLQKAQQSPALQKVIQKTRAEMDTQATEKTIDSAFGNAYNTNTQINENSAEQSPYGTLEKVKCRNEGLEGQKHPVTGVLFVRKKAEVNGKQIDVVVPQFETYYEAQLPEEMYCLPDRKQFKECNRQLKNEVATNMELRAMFSEEQLAQIENAEIPDGYTWHHEVETGIMRLVDRNIHEKTGHTGGRYFWGGGTDNR